MPGDLYYSDSGSGEWFDVANWWQNEELTIQADNYPWGDSTQSYLDFDLRFSDISNQTVTADIGVENLYGSGPGTCFLDNMSINCAVLGGNFVLFSVTLLSNAVFQAGSLSAQNLYLTNGGSIQGTTVVTTDSMTVDNGAYIDGSAYITIAGGLSLIGGSRINAGTFNGPVSNSGGTIYGGTFLGVVNVNDGQGGGAGVTEGGDFYSEYDSDAVANSMLGGQLHYRIALGNGTFYYPADSPFAAPANKVLTGTNNLGVAGTASAGGGSEGGSSPGIGM